MILAMTTTPPSEPASPGEPPAGGSPPPPPAPPLPPPPGQYPPPPGQYPPPPGQYPPGVPPQYVPQAPGPIGEVGKPRSVGLNILLFIVTCGIWSFFWTYWVFEENKRWSGQGIGGVVGLVIQIVFGLINWFLLPNEIQTMYVRDGRESPVSPLLGLWFLLPLIGGIIWYVKVQGALNDFWVSKGAAPA